MIDDAQELLARERALLVQQLLRHRDLADVVQQAGDADALRDVGGEAEVEGEGAGEIADALRVAARVAVLRFQRQRQRADHVLRLLEVGVVLLDAQQRVDARHELEAVQRIVDEVVRAGDDRLLPHARCCGATSARSPAGTPTAGRRAAPSASTSRRLRRHQQVEQHDVDRLALEHLQRLAPHSRARTSSMFAPASVAATSSRFIAVVVDAQDAAPSARAADACAATVAAFGTSSSSDDGEEAHELDGRTRRPPLPRRAAASPRLR